MTVPFGSLLKAKADCECGHPQCDKYGTLGKPDRNGRRHVNGCPCASCAGRLSNRNGHKKQAKAAKALGIDRGRGAPRNEERWGGEFDVEVKSGKQVGPVLNWWLRVENQVLGNRPHHGDRRKPVMGVAMPDGMSDGLVVIRLSVWQERVVPALNEFNGGN